MKILYRAWRRFTSRFKPWKRGQRAIWYQLRWLKNSVNEINLDLEAVRAKLESKPKRGRPKKSS